jgi:hypothetical protein
MAQIWSNSCGVGSFWGLHPRYTLNFIPREELALDLTLLPIVIHPRLNVHVLQLALHCTLGRLMLQWLHNTQLSKMIGLKTVPMNAAIRNTDS